MKFRLIIFLISFSLLQGCAYNAATKWPELQSYSKASEGKVGGLVRLIRGSAQYCMAALHNMEAKASVTYEDGKCTILIEP